MHSTQSFMDEIVPNELFASGSETVGETTPISPLLSESNEPTTFKSAFAESQSTVDQADDLREIPSIEIDSILMKSAESIDNEVASSEQPSVSSASESSALDGTIVESSTTVPSNPPCDVLKRWDFDGLIIESICVREQDEGSQTKPAIIASAESDDGDDASTVILDDNEIQEQLQSIREIEQQIASNMESLELESIAEEQAAAAAGTEENFGGAAGLWAQDFQLPCFTGPQIIHPTFERLEVQRSSFDIQLNDKGFYEVQKLTGVKPKKPPCSYDDLVKVSTDDIVATKEIADCAVCKRELETGRGVELKDCLHTFCRRCLVHAINNSETAVVTCPSKNVKCCGEIHQSEIKSLLNPEAYEKYNLDMLLKLDALDLAELHGQYEFVENVKEFKCEICQQAIPQGDGIVIKNCLHEYCKPCLGQYIKTAGTAVMPCPFRDEDGAVCIGFLLDSEVRSLVPTPVYLEVVQRSLAEAEASNPNAYHCKTPDCPAWVEIDPDVEQFQCQACKTENCVLCKAVHQGMTCNDYQDIQHGPDRRARENAATEDQVRGMIAAKNAQPCPKCGILVQRTEGCREMICTRCQCNFVWFGN